MQCSRCWQTETGTQYSFWCLLMSSMRSNSAKICHQNNNNISPVVAMISKSLRTWKPHLTLSTLYKCQMALINFTLSNARQFYSSMGNPLGWKGLTTWKAKNYVPVNPFHLMSAKWHLLIITLSNARPFYSSTGNPLGWKGLTS